MFRRRSSAGLLLAGLLLSALPGAVSGQSPAPPVTPEGIDWRLVQVAGSGVPFIDVPAGVDATLRIDGTQAGGQGGCNSWFGTVKLEGDAIAFSDVGSTMMACEEPAMGFEGQYLGTLPSIARWAIVDGALELMDANGATLLVFASDATAGVPIEGTDWQAALLFIDGELVAIPDGIAVTLRLDAGQAGGSTGCNQWFGVSTLTGDTLTFGAVGGTEMACPEPRMQIESAWYTALGLVTGWHISASELHLLDGGGNDLAVLVPAAGTSIVGTWQLAEIVDGDVVALIDSDATLTFAEDRSLTGSTGCNTLSGDVVVEGDALKIGPVATTKMACKDPVLARTETLLLAALADTAGCRITGEGWLELVDADGALLAGFVPGIVTAS